MRSPGAPTTIARDFALDAGGTYAVCVANGGVLDKYPRATSARIDVDRQPVVVPGDFNSRPRSLTRVVKLKAGKHRIDMTVHGQPGTGMAVSLFQGTACPPVEQNNRSPKITSSPGANPSVNVGQAFVYDVEATDPDGDTLTYTLSAGPQGMTIDPATGLVAWTPPSVGTTLVTVNVSDGRGGSATQSFKLSAVKSNRNPTITSSPGGNPGVNVGQTFVYDVEAADPDGDTLTYALFLAPAGMTIDPTTGLVSWTPVGVSPGVRSVRVEVYDGQGGGVAQGFAIDVLAAENRPPVGTADQFDVGLGQTLVVPPSGLLGNDTDPDGQPLSARLVSPPNEGTLTLQPDGGFTYTPRGLVTPGALNPTIEWSQSVFRVGRSSTQIMMTPVVIDANRDGVPEIFVATHAGDAWGGVGYLRALAGGLTPVSDFNLVRMKNATVQVSSTYSASYVPDRAIDGDLQTSWFSARQDLGPFFQVTFPSATVVREIRMFGNRQFPTGHDFLSGQFELFDGLGNLVYATGSVALPVPDRDVVLTLPAAVAGVTRVRFTATGLEVPTDDHGFAELEIIGDAMVDPGTELWSVGNQVVGSSGLAAADIDGDGFAEIVGQHTAGGLVAFEHDGAVKWRSVDLGLAGSTVGSPSLADLDGDGTPEVVVGSAVVNADGTVRWGPVASTDTGDNGWGPISVVADLDLDGRPEVVTGRSAYRADGSVYWTTSLADGFTAVGNFDLDPFPEIVSVSNSAVRLLEHDGRVKWGPVALPGGGRGGPPTIADVDADGQPEIGVAGSTRYVVFETDGTIKWQVVTQDGSSNVTGSSVFDFEGDGQAEIVYGDELYLRILRGADGAELFRMLKGSATLHEIPTIADVDGDGRAEIIVGANNWDFGAQTGLFVIGGANNDWVATRAIWNQHAYRVTNVRADGTIPATEPQHWLVPGLNAFRTNGFMPGDPDRATSFTYRASDGSLESNDTVVRITLRQPNSPPAIADVSNAVAAVGVEFLLGLTVSDPDLGDTITFQLLTGPAGMNVDPVTGLTRWTPSGAQQGSHTVTIRALDDRGLSDVATFSVDVALPVTVPSVTGSSQAAAIAAVQSAGLSVPPVATAYSLSVPSGSVIAQLPLPGTLVAPTTPVHLQVSAGLQPVAVPNLVGLTPAAATALLTGNGLVIGTVTFTTTNAAAANTVTVQNPAAGAVAGVTTAVDVVVSTGPAIAVSLSSGLVQAGGSTTILLQAFDPNGVPVVPLPPVGLTLTTVPGESTGTPPVVAGNVITTAADTRGRFTLRAALSTGDTASAVLVVSRPGTVGSGLYSTLGNVLGDLTGDVSRLETALLSVDLASLPALRDALVATRDRLDLDGLAGANALAPEGGFLPTLAQLSAAGFPETPADVAWNTALRNVIATLRSLESVYAQLSASSPVNDDARLLALTAQLQTRISALRDITPTLHGVVRRANVVNQLVSIRIPRLLDAQVSAIARALRDGGLARSVEPLDRFYGERSAPLLADARDPASYYGRRQPVFFSLPSLMSANRIQMDLIKDIYFPIMGEVIKGAGILVANNLVRSYTNAGSLVGVVTGASVSFNVFNMGGSVIEGFGFDRDFPEGNQVFIVGPSAIDAFTTLLDRIRNRPDSFEDVEALVEYFDGLADDARNLGSTVFDSANMTPSGVVGGCIFDFSSACSELVYDAGFNSVHTSGSFAAPVLFLVRNVVTGSWGIYIAPFLPAAQP